MKLTALNLSTKQTTMSLASWCGLGLYLDRQSHQVSEIAFANPETT